MLVFLGPGAIGNGALPNPFFFELQFSGAFIGSPSLVLFVRNFFYYRLQQHMPRIDAGLLLHFRQNRPGGSVDDQSIGDICLPVKYLG